MTLFLVLGLSGLLLLVFALVFDGVLDGVFDGLLSLPVIAGFVSMLGFAGAIALGTTDLGVGVATLVGAGAGLGAGWATWRLSRALMRDGSGAAPGGAELVGSSGAVVTAIPVGGYGEVLLYPAGQPVKYAAKSDVRVERGAEVWVEAALSATSVAVRPVER
ncbi:hypothetical protein [Streptomyces geranii]|uniref:hypothetical protein n=1 Tax=Streptomyces geranii TaxID=2058923 RepID=UPI000D0470C7|nr:hypothetical protein [Streptomyces geranii]